MVKVYVAKLYRDYLADYLDEDVGIKSDVPAIRPRKLVVVTTVPAGPNPKPKYLTWRRLIVQWWVGNDDDGGQFGEDLRELIVDSAKRLATVHKVVILGEPGRFDDPDDASPRFQMTFDVLIKPILN